MSNVPQGMINSRYDNTVHGVRKMVYIETGMILSPHHTYERDPAVEGVWRVTWKDEPEKYMIVYLGGYKDPYGIVRVYDDLEMSEALENDL